MPSFFNQLAVFQRVTITIAESQCFKLSLFKHYCVRPNSRRGETVFALQVKGNDTLVENNYVYSIFKLIKEQELVLSLLKESHLHTSTNTDTPHRPLWTR